MKNLIKKGWLILEDGTEFSGSFIDDNLQANVNSTFERAGEVVFNTSHSGYEEIATDPSYYHQIIVMSAPQQGNYSVSKECWESKEIYIEGFVTVELQQSSRNKEWKNALIQTGRPILNHAFTRDIILHLRNTGTLWGAIVGDKPDYKKNALDLIEKKKAHSSDWVGAVSCKSIERQQGSKSNGPKIGIFDFGSKENILRQARKRSCELVIFPSTTTSSEIRSSQIDGLILTNGPGDPMDVKSSVKTIRELLGFKPIFGICMGHQLLGMALGAKTYKLKYGHRGGNHPVKDLRSGQVYMTSQNHGYAVDQNTLDAESEVTHLNLNDNSVAGLMNKKKKCLSVQFHPESCPGPHEANTLFDEFFSGVW